MASATTRQTRASGADPNRFTRTELWENDQPDFGKSVKEVHVETMIYRKFKITVKLPNLKKKKLFRMRSRAMKRIRKQTNLPRQWIEC